MSRIERRRTRPLGRAARAALWTAGGLTWAAAARRIAASAPDLDRPPLLSKPLRKATVTAVVKEAASQWSAHEAPRRGAALAYYTIFSMAPLLLILAAVIGVVLGDEAARGLLSEQLRGLLGADRARVLESMVASAQQGSGARAGTIGFVMLLLGAGAAVGELQASLMAMWGTIPKKSGLATLVKNRLMSAAFVLTLGFILLVSLAVSSAAATAGKFLSSLLPLPEAALQAINAGVSLGMIASVFALIFKYLPRARIAWGDVWLGAGVTAALFSAGNILLGLYVGKGGPTSAYGAAGALLGVLLWTYYCAQILFFGAEFTRVYAERRGSGFRRGTAPSS
jgi:membrane protein